MVGLSISWIVINVLHSNWNGIRNYGGVIFSHALAQTTPNNFYHPSIDIPLALISMFQYEPTIISDPIPVAVEDIYHDP